jgi:hypothetical protein
MTGQANTLYLRFADDLERLLSSRLTAEEFESRYRSGREAQVLGEFIGSISHYLADADIRAREPEYRAMQEREMRLLIGHLRAGRFDHARRIDFLRVTHDR